MSTARTLKQHARAHYRLAVCRAKKRGQPPPDRENHIAAYLARHGEAAPLAKPATNDALPVSCDAPAPYSGIVGHPTPETPIASPNEAQPAETPIKHIERCPVCHFSKRNCYCNRGY